MGLRGLNKGKRGEREIKDLLQEVVDEVYGDAPYKPKVQRNTLQSDCGGADLTGLPWLAVEVKRCEQLNVNTWWKQALRQGKPGQTPVLLYRQNRTPWRCMTSVKLICMNGMTITCRGEISFEAFMVWFRNQVLADKDAKLQIPG